MSLIYPENFEIKTEFSKIREIIKEHCLSKPGKARVNKMKFLTEIEEIEKLLNLTSEFKNIIELNKNFPVSYFIDTKSYFEKTESIGTYFSAKELFDIVRSLNTIKSILNFFKNEEENKYPTLRKLAKEISIFPFVIQRIDSVIDKYGNIKNNASLELSKIRNNLSNKQSKISNAVHRILKKEIASGNVDSDAEITVRDNKLLIPVESKNKRKIQGIIFDESATGKTAYIEPIEVVSLNNAIRELQFAENREIRKILTNLTDDIRPYFNDLKVSYNFMANVDFIRAKAKFSIDIEAVKPNLRNKNLIEFYNAKHPLLFLAYQNTGKKVIPSNIKLTDEQRIIIISGPNAGGKSVSLKTVAILQYMLQCGLLIPVFDFSVAGIFNKIFIDIGDEQSIENDLSTYSSHLKNMKFFSENSDSQTLILIDEFGTGTEPMLGGAIAEAVLESIHKSNAKGIITTHYTNLKHFADNNDGIINAAMLYDNEKMQPLYKIDLGKPGSSFAFEIAEKTGLKKSILENAKSKIDKNKLDFEKALKQTQSEKRKLKKSKRNIRNTELNLRNTLIKYEDELENLLSKKKTILKEAKLEAEEILKSANKTIEKTILNIRKTNAEKEQTKKLRKELNTYIIEEKEKQRLQDEKIDRKIQKLKEKKKKRKKQETKATDKIPTPKEINIGDYVKIIGMNTIAEVKSISGKKVTVISNNIQLNIDKEKLELSTQKKKVNKKTSVKVFRNTDIENLRIFEQLDVRGKRADEALFAVTRYIDDAIVKQTQHLKILHGTGNGILRQIIRDYLRTNQLVKKFKDERIEAGGTGITLIELDL